MVPNEQASAIQRHCTICGMLLDHNRDGSLCHGCLLNIGLEESSEMPSLPIRCPHCCQLVEILDCASLRDIECPMCENRFSVIDEMMADCPTLHRFDLLAVIGAGSFGTVWKARDRELDRQVVVKIPHQSQLSSVDLNDDPQNIPECHTTKIRKISFIVKLLN